ncbi:amino acid transporter [Saitoella coloradoensis]
MASTAIELNDHNDLKKTPSALVRPSSRDVEEGDVKNLGPSENLHRGLKARHITMIAIGGAVGTGLIIGTGSALTRAGPAGVLITYSIVGLIVYAVMCALGEMASYLPLPHGFAGYASRFVDPALGFALGYNYWFKYIIVTPNQLTAAALVLQFWCPRDQVNPGVWIAIFMVLIICINYFGIKFFGEFEFWLSSIKVVVIIALILLCLILACGGGPSHDKSGYYWRQGAFNEYIAEGAKGRFLAVWSCFITATFAYLGTELVGVTVGEARNPRRTVPKAIRLTFFRILVFYVLSVLLLGLIVPYNSKDLVTANKASTSAAASPFVVAIRLAGIPVLPGFLNACILIFVISAANSDLYIASRTIFALAKDGKAPAFLARTDKRGVPIYALALSSSFCLLAFLNVSNSSATVFKYFVNLVTIFGILTWISILVTHLFFMKAVTAQGLDRHRDLPYAAPFAPYSTWAALIFCCLICIFKGFDTIAGGFNKTSFITSYIGIPVFLIFLFGYKIAMKSKRVRAEEADLVSGKAEIDQDEQDFLDEQEAAGEKKGFYRFLSWLF